MTTLEEFVSQLKAFFKDAHHFLTETCEDYSMNAEDDNKRDALVEGINKLQKLMVSLTKHGGSKPLPPPIVDEIYDDTVEPNNNKPQDEEEYLAPTSVRPNQADGGIMEEEYEDAESQKPTRNVKPPDDGIMEDMYEDPTGDENTGKVEEGIMEDTYEDPYADGRREAPPPKSGSTQEEEEGAITEDMYEDPYADGQRKEPPIQPKINEKNKKEKDKKSKKIKDRTESDNRSECSSEDVLNNKDTSIKTISASEVADTAFKGFLKKHKAKDSWFKVNRWCAIQDNIMYYFEGQNSKQQKGAINLKMYEVSEVKDEVKKKKFMFQLTCPARKTYFFSTNQEEEMKEWIKFLGQGELPDIELNSDDAYEVGDDNLMASQGNKSDASKKEEEEDEGIMEETYEDPDPTYVPKVFAIAESKSSNNESAKVLPPLPARSEPPPPTPKRDVSIQPPPTGGRAPLPPPITDEIYDDAASALPEDEEYYDDGTSVKPPEATSPKPPVTQRSPITTQPQSNLHKPAIQPPISNDNKRSSLPPPPENVIKFDAMYYGVWSCQNVGDDELEFNRGDCIEIVNKAKYEKEGWWVGKLGSKVGLVPKSYLSPMYKEI